VVYKRAVGYFTSAALAEAARGLVDFVKNYGKMHLIASPRLTERDIKNIEEGYELRETIQKALKRGLDQNITKVDLIRVKNLTWMIANNRLDIRIAVPKSKEDEGIYHEKIGLFYDPHENIVAFSGSLNETALGLISNYESIDVSLSWDKGDRERQRVRDHVEHFKRLWEGTAAGLIVVDFPKAVQQALLEKYEPTRPVIEPFKKRRPYPFQARAITAWKESGCKGVLAMATGSGKTFTALKALDSCDKLKLSLIIVPSIDLVSQWEEEIRKEYGQNCIVRKAHSKEKDWEGKAQRLIEALVDYGFAGKRPFVITTIHTASKSKFIKVMKTLPEGSLGIVVDEVHHAGAPTFRNVFSIPAKFRIGLSATPDREWDEEGNQSIFDYFGRVVYEYDISDAIKDGVLSRYFYYPHVVSLNYREKSAFSEISKSIASVTHHAYSEYPNTRNMSIPRLLQYLDSLNSEISLKLRTLFLKRVEIIRKAANKFDAFREIIKTYELKRCLVYCNDLAHLEENIGIVHEEGLEPIEFSSRIDPNIRERILQAFDKKVEQNTLLLAVKCLDEGVDIPACDSAILISCSRSTREFVQRRGRVLRKHPTKEYSSIHDIVVLPFTKEEDAYPINPSEFGFVKEELRRIEILSKNALNKDEINVNGILRLYRKYLLT
jgi:superfamily II DNA or RNA helicase